MSRVAQQESGHCGRRTPLAGLVQVPLNETAEAKEKRVHDGQVTERVHHPSVELTGSLEKPITNPFF